MIDLQQTLATAHTIAVVGCSADPRRTSHRIARYLQRAGYRILPVNPNYEEVLGEPCYPDLQHIPKETQLDIVNIFRRSAHTADMVRQVVQWQAETGQTPVVWTQLGVSSPEAERLARQAGLPYVKNRCIAVEHGRLVDG
ncbi:MAG: CoA-binding protein [Rhodothermaceae bacterium]|nr:MAG: CoA-binding protein [Rhodothermaceae bacterium]